MIKSCNNWLRLMLGVPRGVGAAWILTQRKSHTAPVNHTDDSGTDCRSTHCDLLYLGASIALHGPVLSS